MSEKDKVCARFTGQTEADVEAKFDTGSLPDWLISPEEYESCSAIHQRRTYTENESSRRLPPVYTYGIMN